MYIVLTILNILFKSALTCLQGTLTSYASLFIHALFGDTGHNKIQLSYVENSCL